MSVLTTTCSHCGASPVPHTVHTAWKSHADELNVAVHCPTCSKPSIIVLRAGSTSRATVDWFGTTTAKGNVDLVTESGWSIAAQYPESGKTEVPEHTPSDIGRLYRQAHSAKARGERETAGFVFGKVLEVSLKKIDPDTKGSLSDRIDAVAAKDRISGDVKKWAHEIRIVRNDAVHEVDEPSESDIAEIAEFVEAFLIFVFTMPKKYELRTSRKTPK